MALDLPDPDRAQLPRSPLELVVCQIRFDRQIANSDGKVARAFGEMLVQKYPDFAQISDVAGAEVSFGLAPGVSQVNQNPLNGWRFGSSDTLAALLMPDHVSLETSAYTCWEDFSPRLSHLVDCTAEIVDPALEQRLGMRYVDRITEPRLTNAPAWAKYIRPELLGPILHPAFGPHVQATQQQVVLSLDAETNCGLRHGLLGNPESGTVDYVLDYDLYREGGRPFDADNIKQVLETFHTAALQLFQASITEDLLELLRA
jgi:uncharacterized protein (TIGR04255 family)